MTNKELFKRLVQDKLILIKGIHPNQIRMGINTILSIMGDTEVLKNRVFDLRNASDDTILATINNQDFIIYESDGGIRYGVFQGSYNIRNKGVISMRTLNKLIYLRDFNYDLLRLYEYIKYD